MRLSRIDHAQWTLNLSEVLVLKLDLNLVFRLVVPHTFKKLFSVFTFKVGVLVNLRTDSGRVSVINISN